MRFLEKHKKHLIGGDWTFEAGRFGDKVFKNFFKKIITERKGWVEFNGRSGKILEEVGEFVIITGVYRREERVENVKLDLWYRDTG